MIFILFILAISFLISKGVSTRIKTLTSKMSEYSPGKSFVPINDRKTDDIGMLSNTYDALVMRNNALIDEVYIADVKQKQAQINFLTAQINPHFLYNTLNIINCMALEKRFEETSEMILALSNFLRLSLTNEKIHSISKEIQHASSYIAICNYRFADRIKMKVDIGNEISNIKIPPLTLQPIVENSIIHSIDNNLTPLNITISAEVFDSTVAIEIADDGVGIEPETLIEINDNMNSPVKDGLDVKQRIGIKNVQSRLKLIYGEEYGINIISKVGYGTNCIITIPLR